MWTVHQGCSGSLGYCWDGLALGGLRDPCSCGAVRCSCRRLPLTGSRCCDIQVRCYYPGAPTHGPLHPTPRRPSPADYMLACRLQGTGPWQALARLHVAQCWRPPRCWAVTYASASPHPSRRSSTQGLVGQGAQQLHGRGDLQGQGRTGGWMVSCKPSWPSNSPTVRACSRCAHLAPAQRQGYAPTAVDRSRVPCGGHGHLLRTGAAVVRVPLHLDAVTLHREQAPAGASSAQLTSKPRHASTRARAPATACVVQGQQLTAPGMQCSARTM